MSDYDPDAILADPGAHPLHRMYAEINIGVRDRGERWAKCANCGDPYRIITPDEETPDLPVWANSTVCSDACAHEYTAYLNEGL